MWEAFLSIASMQAEGLAITGIGMVSSLGLDVVTSCAAARAGISRASELDGFQVLNPESNDVEPVVGHAVPLIMDGFTGLGRLVRIALAALEDLLQSVDVPDDGKTGLVLNLPSGYFLAEFEKWEEQTFPEKFRPNGHYETEIRQTQYKDEFIPKLKRFTGLTTAAAQDTVFFNDQVGSVTALQHTTALLQNGTISRCIIGGVDSCLEIAYLRACNHFGVLKTVSQTNGFMPGEAAAFAVVERLETARRRGAPVKGVLRAPNNSKESFHRLSGDRAAGQSISQSISKTLAMLPDMADRTGLTIGALNGDDHRAHDWGSALVRLRRDYEFLGQQPEWYPAAAFGEIGAASGFAALCMGVRAFERDYAKTDGILIWLASDSGDRGAMYLSTYASN